MLVEALDIFLYDIHILLMDNGMESNDYGFFDDTKVMGMNNSYDIPQ